MEDYYNQSDIQFLLTVYCSVYGLSTIETVQLESMLKTTIYTNGVVIFIHIVINMTLNQQYTLNTT